MSVVFKILNAAAPLAQSIIENVVDYKKLKAENEILAKQKLLLLPPTKNFFVL